MATIAGPERIRELLSIKSEKIEAGLLSRQKIVYAKIQKIIMKQIAKGKKEFVVSLGFTLNPKISLEDYIGIFKRYFLMLEKVGWFISFSLLRRFQPVDISLDKVWKTNNAVVSLTISEYYLWKNKNAHYRTPNLRESVIAIDQDKTCIICSEYERSTVLLNCGHAKYCWECAEKLRKCPECRRRVVDIKRIYT